MYEIEKLIEQRAAIGAQADAVLKANAETRSMSGEDQQKFDAIMADFDAKTKLIDAAQKLAEVRAIQPSIETSLPKTEAEKRAFDQFLRRGFHGMDANLRSHLSIGSEGEVRAMATGNVIGDRKFGGLIDQMKYFSGVLAAGATIERTTDGNPLSYLLGDDTGNTGEVLGENPASPDTAGVDPTESNVTLNALVYSSKWIRVSNQRLEDSAYDLAAYIEAKAAERIGRKFNTDSTTAASNATGTAKGVVAAATTVAAASATAFSPDDLITVVHKVDPAYRKNPKNQYMFHDTVLSTIRKAKDTTNKYMWDFQTNTINGYGYQINNDMDSTFASTKKTVLFGDFSKYVVRIVGTPAVKRASERFVEFNQTGFIQLVRMDGALLDSRAIAALTH